jgi:phosphohistidine phosphatase
MADPPRRALWILRHAKSRRRPPVGGDDHERVLEERGRRDADALGARLGDGGDRLGLPEDLVPQLVLCSTAARAVETTERVLAQMSTPPVVTYLRSLYEATPEEVLEHVSMTDDVVRSLMIVGHNPTIETLAAAMPASPAPALAGGLATGALAVFTLPVRRWEEVAPRTAGLLGVFAPPYVGA